MIGKFIAFIFGSIVGSFLNVCIHRMPLGESVVWPSSHCPHCKKRIPAYDNVPFLSYLFLGGRCRFCKGKISWRYPLVELLTGLSFLFLFSYYGLNYEFFFYMVLSCALIVATFVDIKHRIIPDEVSVGGLIMGFILSVIKGVNISPFTFNFRPAAASLLGIIVGGAVIYLSGFLFDLVYFKLLKRPPIQGETESMGGGDVKLLAMIGAFLGWEKALFTFFLAPFLGLAIGLFNMIAKKDHTIPYGPFLSIAAVISLFWMHPILRLIFNY
ncbi:MAG TPA: prepilin peptidase [Candidatus Margulisiibacteriota bacterium]|nr:prepilin peptidase [Candidatus Margulisiibacteriota bacterium]